MVSRGGLPRPNCGLPLRGHGRLRHRVEPDFTCLEYSIKIIDKKRLGYSQSVHEIL